MLSQLELIAIVFLNGLILVDLGEMAVMDSIDCRDEFLEFHVFGFACVLGQVELFEAVLLEYCLGLGLGVRWLGFWDHGEAFAGEGDCAFLAVPYLFVVGFGVELGRFVRVVLAAGFFQLAEQGF